MKNSWILGLIAAAVVGWGMYLAVGTYLGGDTLEHNWRRPAVVLACVSAYLGFWWAMLAARKRRIDRDSQQG